MEVQPASAIFHQHYLLLNLGAVALCSDPVSDGGLMDQIAKRAESTADISVLPKQYQCPRGRGFSLSTSVTRNVPIKNPPAGKKYVRCPCNCLLICKDTSRRIGCPRPNCRRIINLSPVMVIPEEQPTQPALPVQPEGMRVVCGHCGNTFLVRTHHITPPHPAGSDVASPSQSVSGLPLDGSSAVFQWMELRFNTLAKCPHCKKMFQACQGTASEMDTSALQETESKSLSDVTETPRACSSALPRRRCCAYITVGMICIFIGVGLTVGTQDFARRYHATYVSWAFAYLLGLICLVRACYWGAIKVSYPENSFA
ncbi:hypothetical protein JZ751_000339 [Albula glossodonta]|uniref:Phosphatidylinositol-4,5-bisphosphate 4-phosphatase n=1 Tax=Albula glossodonta TaxID=121402 RepID=A0A8T2PVZ1_9TELE|nr:hypothetical protein JZ751_000339 [Albula glossodonta]